MTATSPLQTSTWVDICPLESVTPGRGVAALLGSHQQVAVFLLPDGDVVAIDNLDPFSGAHVLARGLVGSKGDAITVASPIYKQRFDVRTGVCLDDDGVTLATFPTRVQGRRIQVQVDGARVANGGSTD